MEFGHIIVNRGGRQCVCGKNGCLEAEAGSAAVLDKLKRKLSDGARSALEMKGGPEEIKISDVYAAALTGDPVALSLAHETAEYLAGGLSCVIQLLNPQKIIIHGPVTALGDKLTDLVRHCLYKYSFPSAVDKTEICLSEADEFSAASGACLAARETVLFGSGNCPGVLFDKIRRDSAGVSRGGA
jgi:N-acetylglucosamine repressor